jgi:hypothetical protein
VEWKTDIGNSLRRTLKSRRGAAPELWLNLTVMTLWIGTRVRVVGRSRSCCHPATRRRPTFVGGPPAGATIIDEAMARRGLPFRTRCQCTRPQIVPARAARRTEPPTVGCPLKAATNCRRTWQFESPVRVADNLIGKSATACNTGRRSPGLSEMVSRCSSSVAADRCQKVRSGRRARRLGRGRGGRASAGCG